MNTAAQPVGSKARLVAMVGAASAAILTTQVPKFEGMVLRGYKDPIGIVTACAGNTRSAVLGRAYTPEECQQLLADDLVAHAEPVLKCTPILARPEYVGPRSAAISFTFNVGAGNYCSSTMARKFNAGDFIGACAELSKWTRAGGKELPGLVTRRATERAICEGKLS